MGSLALSRVEALDRPAPSISDEVTRIARQELAPLAADIDSGTVYPDALLRSLGKVGAWSSHVPQEGPADLRWAIQSIASLGEVCGATAFMAWCQNTLVWYVANSTNIQLAQRFGDCFSSGRRLGGTGLSNPMKTFFGIEKFKLKGRKVEGGYIVKGALPWVSNLGSDHYFGTIFECEDEPGGTVMFLADCSDPAITLQPCKPFLLGHVNRYLPQQPTQFRELYAEFEKETMALAADPYNSDDSYWRRVISLRLRLGDASVAAAHAAMLHCGARGYLKSHRAQRRLREAYFVAIVTPATKQLRKMLAGD
jgi:alkylation response protein AidB-like acyl-CoA dehydrogenase